MKIFVYGSLKRGFYNHERVGKMTYLKDMVLDGFEMYKICSFPGIKRGTGTVHGEVYEVEGKTYEKLEYMERSADFYPIQYDGMTVFIRDTIGSKCPKVPHGMWTLKLQDGN